MLKPPVIRVKRQRGAHAPAVTPAATETTMKGEPKVIEYLSGYLYVRRTQLAGRKPSSILRPGARVVSEELTCFTTLKKLLWRDDNRRVAMGIK